LYSLFFKRIIDFVLALLGLIFALPVFVVLTILLAIANNGNAYFIQERPGKNGKVFHLIKFRTMNNKCDEKGKLLSDHARLTPIGRFVRSTSLDEIPQLFNVLKGDMSLIGPRPLLVKYLPLYTKTQARRHVVKPGITGWTQVNGRNSLTWEKKFELDVWYVDHVSFTLDLKILWLTIIKVFKREGINAADAATMKPFTGNN